MGKRIGLSIFSWLFCLSSFSATYTISNTNDSGTGSLRAAITTANGVGGANVIDATGVTGTIILESALPYINSSIIINGPTS